MIKAIIFDWHGVLDNTKFEGLMMELSSASHLSKNTIKILLEEKKKEYVLGKITSTAFWSHVRKTLNLNQKQLEKAYNYNISISINTELWEMLPSLFKRFTLAILSDCPIDKIMKIREKTSFSLFAESVFSAEVGKTKDNNDFYYELSNKLKIKPHETLYVDDSLKHIQTAKRLGYIAHHFTSAQALAKSIHSLNQKL